MKIYTIKKDFFFPLPVPYIEEWEFLEENSFSFKMNLYGNKHTVSKRNIFWFWNKNDAIEKRKEMLEKQIQEAKAKLQRLTNQYERVDYVVEMSSQPLPTSEQLIV